MYVASSSQVRVTKSQKRSWPPGERSKNTVGHPARHVLSPSHWQTYGHAKEMERSRDRGQRTGTRRAVRVNFAQAEENEVGERIWTLTYPVYGMWRGKSRTFSRRQRAGFERPYAIHLVMHISFCSFSEFQYPHCSLNYQSEHDYSNDQVWSVGFSPVH